MPIYAYKCGSCGHAKDVLQKISDAPLSECPACGASTISKQVTAAGFQLKGSGWYATDFRGGSTAAAPAEGKSEAGGKSDSNSESSSDKPKESGKSDTSTTTKGDAPAAAGGCRASCACH